MEQLTIEGILDRPLLQLVKDAPTNQMTRGQVRAATNLVLPDGVNTTEGIIEYVLENYDKDKAPAKDWNITSDRMQRGEQFDVHADRESVLAQAARTRARREEDARLDRAAMFITEVEATENRTYDTTEIYMGTFCSQVRFSPEDFDGCSTMSEVIEAMKTKAYDQMQNDGIVDEDHIDTSDSEFRDSDEFEHTTNYEDLWERNKEIISGSLGLTPEEMEG